MIWVLTRRSIAHRRVKTSNPDGPMKEVNSEKLSTGVDR